MVAAVGVRACVNIRRAAAFLVVAAVAAGCNHSIFGPDYSLNVSNGTTIPVTLVVNDKHISVIEPGNGAMLHAGDMPALPWTVVLTTTAGRTLATLPVAEGSVVDERALDGTGLYSAPFSRTVLTCGELRIQIGDTAFSGGGPAEGVAGDCGP